MTYPQPSMKWVSDITYIQTQEGFLYLTTIIDLYDRKVIGWSLSHTMSTEETSLAAWKMAIKNRSIKKGMLFIPTEAFNMHQKKLQTYLILMVLFVACQEKEIAGIML